MVEEASEKAREQVERERDEREEREKRETRRERERSPFDLRVSKRQRKELRPRRASPVGALCEKSPPICPNLVVAPTGAARRRLGLRNRLTNASTTPLSPAPRGFAKLSPKAGELCVAPRRGGVGLGRGLVFRRVRDKQHSPRRYSHRPRSAAPAIPAAARPDPPLNPDGSRRISPAARGKHASPSDRQLGDEFGYTERIESRDREALLAEVVERRTNVNECLAVNHQETVVE